MARPARFSDSDLLDAAAEVAAANGPAATTISAIAEAAGAPTGSLYHRFPSRDVLLGTLWLDLVGRFQAGWIEALEQGDPEAAALHTPAWVRAPRTSTTAPAQCCGRSRAPSSATTSPRASGGCASRSSRSPTRPCAP